MKSKSILISFILIIVLAGCLPPNPTPSPIASPTPQTSPLAVPVSQRSKVSVMIGLKPDGLDDFLQIAQPTIIYSINNAVKDTLNRYSPHTILIRRIQNDVWSRLPDCMYCGLFDSDWEAQARKSARHELTEKMIYVPNRGNLNYIQFVKLSHQDFVAPMNEPVLGQGDYVLKARWLNAWFEEWLTIAHANGLHGCIYSFPTGEPIIAAVPYLVGSARIAAQNGDIIDVHEYGVEGPLMSSPSSGAFGFVRFHDALPTDARPNFIVSEFSAGNGYDTGLDGGEWISDAVGYGERLREYPYLLGAAAFQLDHGAESNIPPDVLHDFAYTLARINWSISWYIYLPVVMR